MKKPDELFDLIKSLDKREKRYFKLYASVYSGEQTNYLRLFNALEKQETYDEEALRKLFEGETFIKQLHVTKNYLYNLILTSLSEFMFRHSTDYRLKEQLKQVHALFEKRLYTHAWQLVLRIRKTAEQTENILIQIEAIRWLRRIAIRNDNTTYLVQKAKELNRCEEELFEQLQNNFRLSRLNERVFTLDRNSGRRLSPEELQSWEELIQHPNLTNENELLDYESRFMYNHIYAFYQLVKNNPEISGEYEKKNLIMLEEKPYRIHANPSRYIVALNNYISSQRFLYRPDEFYKSLDKLKNLEKKLPTYLLSDEIRARLFILSFMQDARFGLTQGRFDYVTGLIEKNNERITKYLNTKHFNNSLYYCIALGAYFGADDFRTALHYLNKINSETEALPLATRSIMRVIGIIVHLELNNFDLIPYQIRSAFRFISRSNRSFKLEVIFLKYVKKRLLYTNSKKELLASFSELREELLVLLRDPYEARAFEYFDFISWLDSKIEGRSFGDVVREKLAGHEYIVY